MPRYHWFVLIVLIGFSACKTEKKNGTVTTYFKSGKKSAQYTLLNGKYHGRYDNWRKDGTPMSQNTYAHGKLVKAISFGLKGEKQSEQQYTYTKGKKTELFKIWSPKGQLVSQKSYLNSKEHGISYQWYKTGKRMSKIHHKHGETNGPIIRWFQDEKIWYKGHFNMGKRTGRWDSWYGNGKKEAVYFYNDGKPCGTWQSWDKAGKPQQSKDTDLKGTSCKLTPTGATCPACSNSKASPAPKRLTKTR